MKGLTAQETAVSLLERGFWPTIIYPAGHILLNGERASGKEPARKDWGKFRLTAEGIEKWYTQIPGAGVGVCLGRGKGSNGRRLVDIEVDDRGVGDDSLSKLVGELVETMGWESARGGHLLFYFDETRATELWGSWLPSKDIAELPGIQLLGFSRDGQHQSIVPPTIGTDGRPRRWNDCPDIAPLPEAAYKFLNSIRPAVVEPSPAAGYTGRASNGNQDHGENSKYGEKALSDECDKVAAATEGCRHSTLRDAGLRVFALVKDGHLDEHDARRELTAAGRQCGLDEREIREALDWAKTHATARALPATPHPKTQTVTQDCQSKTHTVTHVPKEQSYVTVIQSYVTELDKVLQSKVDKHTVSSPTDDIQKALFNLYRRLDPVRREGGWQDADWLPVVNYWRTKSNERGASLPELDKLWPIFTKILANASIKKPYGRALKLVKNRIENVKVPAGLVGTKDEATAKVLIAFWEARRSGELTFFADYETIMGLSGDCNKMTVGRRLFSLHKAGYLSRLKVGQHNAHLASEWTWHDPPCPGKTIWNKAMTASDGVRDTMLNASNTSHQATEVDAASDGLADESPDIDLPF